MQRLGFKKLFCLLLGPGILLRSGKLFILSRRACILWLASVQQMTGSGSVEAVVNLVLPLNSPVEETSNKI